MIKLNPRYIVDFGKGKFHIFDRETLNFLDEMNWDEFRGLKWMNEIGSLAGEAAHLAKYSKWSKSSPWKSKDSIKEFYELCEKMGVELRLLPQRSIWKFREKFNPAEEKSDRGDIKIWHEAINKYPYIWDVAQKPKNVEWHDPKELDVIIEKYKKGDKTGLTYLLAGNIYKQKLKDASRLVSAGEIPYKKTKSGEKAYDQIILREVARRLQNHNSDDGKITNGISKEVINGKTIEISLLDVLDFEKDKKGEWKCHKECQYVSCMMLLIDQETGERHLNPLTDQPVGFKMIKQFGFVSSGFHDNPGFLRPKFYHHGIKSYSKKYFKKIFEVKKMDYSNDEHEKLKDFIMKTCRIAYEQTVKAMKKCLDNPSNPSNTLEEYLK